VDSILKQVDKDNVGSLRISRQEKTVGHDMTGRLGRTGPIRPPV